VLGVNSLQELNHPARLLLRGSSTVGSDYLMFSSKSLLFLGERLFNFFYISIHIFPFFWYKKTSGRRRSMFLFCLLYQYIIPTPSDCA
jgi:hypothetical protein